MMSDDQDSRSNSEPWTVTVKTIDGHSFDFQMASGRTAIASLKRMIAEARFSLIVENLGSRRATEAYFPRKVA